MILASIFNDDSLSLVRSHTAAFAGQSAIGLMFKGHVDTKDKAQRILWTQNLQRKVHYHRIHRRKDRQHLKMSGHQLLMDFILMKTLGTVGGSRLDERMVHEGGVIGNCCGCSIRDKKLSCPIPPKILLPRYRESITCEFGFMKALRVEVGGIDYLREMASDVARFRSAKALLSWRSRWNSSALGLRGLPVTHTDEPKALSFSSLGDCLI